MQQPSKEPTPEPGIKRLLLNGALVFFVLLVILAIVAYLAGDGALPMEYEGID